MPKYSCEILHLDVFEIQGYKFLSCVDKFVTTKGGDLVFPHTIPTDPCLTNPTYIIFVYNIFII